MKFLLLFLFAALAANPSICVPIHSNAIDLIDEKLPYNELTFNPWKEKQSKMDEDIERIGKDSPESLTSSQGEPKKKAQFQEETESICDILFKLSKQMDSIRVIEQSQSADRFELESNLSFDQMQEWADMCHEDSESEEDNWNKQQQVNLVINKLPNQNGNMNKRILNIIWQSIRTTFGFVFNQIVN
jgi:hypothetical protein